MSNDSLQIDVPNSSNNKADTMAKPSLNQWQRLSPWSIIFFIGKMLSRLLKDALPSIAPLALVIFNSENKLSVITAIVIASTFLIIISSLLQYWFFKFKQQDHKILIHDGVFKKNHRVIQFDRIQNINILQPLYFKLFDLVTLQIETAGSKGNEADLAGIPIALSEQIKEAVLKQQKNNDEVQDTKNQDNLDSHSNLMVNASFKDIIKYGISSNGIFWFFIFLAPLFNLLEEMIEKWINQNEVKQIVGYFGEGLGGNIFIGASISLSVLILMFSFSIIGAIFRFYNYQLTVISGVTLKRVSGLLTRYEESLKRQKIQSFITQTNFIGQWLKIQHITLGQVSTGQINTKNTKSMFVIPARNSSEVNDIQQTVFHDSPVNIQTSGISKRYITKTMALKIFFPSFLFSLVLYLNTSSMMMFSIPFIFSAVMLPLVIKRWRAYRFGMNDGYGKFERGLFGFRRILFPLYKVQRVEVRQSPIQRRKHLATLKIYLASNNIQMQYIPIKDANDWLNRIRCAVELTRQPWY